MAVTTPLNLKNVQGDILIALPKKAESCFFFQITRNRVPQFRESLAKLVPLITSTEECGEHRTKIMGEKQKAANERRAPELVKVVGINISFSQKGLNTLGITDDIGDAVFKNGMLSDATNLGDDLNKWDPKFKQDIHGVLLITGDSVDHVKQTLDKVKGIFSFGRPEASITEVIELDGHTRPGNEDGHEHFGFLDCISQPAIDGVTNFNNPGQETIPQGVALLGREGDDGVLPSPLGVLPPNGKPAIPVKRPSWAVDGSFLAFRYLRQLVPEFDNFLAENALDVPHPIAPGDPSGADLLGARLMGRWKSGAPVDLTPIRDDPALGPDPTRNNNFIYDPTSQVRCPFAAHTRKTNPRSDLFSLGIPTEPRRILRRGIQFGPEVTPAEAKAKKSSDDEKLERGLLFVAYQSNIANGFQFLQHSWANAAAFPPAKAGANIVPPIPNGQPGIDPIIGQATPRTLVGTNPTAATTSLNLTEEFVVSKGGEYFFSPSISALKTKFALAGAAHQEL